MSKAFAACLLVTFARYALGEQLKPPSEGVHAFYYPWYANPATDGRWGHWNHRVMLRKGGGKAYTPPADIGANFYPELGCYSTRDPAVLAEHMKQCRQAGIGVICLSWWGKGSVTDQAVPGILKAAADGGIKVNFHIEPYPGRGAASVRADIVYILDKYGGSPAFYRDASRGRRPMFYVYDSYLTKEADWHEVLAAKGTQTIRGTKYDSLVIALWVKAHEESFVLNGGFDGFYTYFATEGFTYGSTPANWKRLAAWARQHGKLFIPSVGPGYDDTRIRPWNRRNTRDRAGGAYYDRMWQAAIDADAEIVSVTSFNEWHEGAQIEPAVPKQIPGYKYLDYLPREPDYYLKRTRHWAAKLQAALPGPHIECDRETKFEVALGPDSPTGQASIREHAIAWHPIKKKFYLIADVVPLDNPNHPHTYDTELYLWSSADLAPWRFVGLAVPKGKAGLTYDGYGVGSPAGMVYKDGKLYVPFSGRKTARFDQRGIGLAWSGPDPEDLPWTKTDSPISDLSGEDDDPAVVAIPADERLHLYHRTTGEGGGYRIVHTASAAPEDASSWPPAKNVTVRPDGVRAQELTGAVCIDAMLHLFVIEQGPAVGGIRIAHLCSRQPGALFEQADPKSRYLLDQPERLKSGGHFTPVVRDGKLIAGFWTVAQSGRRYGLEGHPIRLFHSK